MGRFFVAVFILLTSGCVRGFGAETLYTAQLLEFQHHALDLNDHGEMAGEYRGSIQQGILFDGSRWIPKGNGDDFSWSALYAINNHHVAVGLNAIPFQAGGSLVVHAVRVEPNGTVRNLGSLTGENGNARARGINDSNVAVGDSLTANGTRMAVRFNTNGIVTDLGTLGMDGSSAVDINNQGDIVGELLSATGVTRGFLTPWDGIMQDIGTLGGTETFVTRINARGEIIGRSKVANGDTHAFIYSDGAMTDLGTLGGKESAAYGVNDAGVVVGGATQTNGISTAFIRYPGQPMIALAGLVGLPQADLLISALAINNHGQIIARGMVNESNYLLKPGVFTITAAEDKVRLKFASPPNVRVRIDAANTLPDWQPLSTNTIAAEPITFDVPMASAAIFFRAVLLADE